MNIDAVMLNFPAGNVVVTFLCSSMFETIFQVSLWSIGLLLPRATLNERISNLNSFHTSS